MDRFNAVPDKEGLVGVVKTAPSNSAKQSRQAFDQAIALGMEILLVKITGQKKFRQCCR